MPATQVSKSQCIELRSNPGYYLLKDAAYAWDRSVAAFEKGVLITGAWRSYETQERIFLERYQTSYIQYAPGKVDARSWSGRTWYRKPGTAAAAVPGTSNHGGGIAVDVKTARQKGDPPYSEAVIFGSWTDADRTRFLRVAAEHGWYDDEGRSVGELWHLTYYSARDKHRGVKPATPTQEDPMTLNTVQATELNETHHTLTEPVVDDFDGKQTFTDALRRLLKMARRAEADRLADEAAPASVDIAAEDVADALLAKLTPAVAKGVADVLAARLAQ